MKRGSTFYILKIGGLGTSKLESNARCQMPAVNQIKYPERPTLLSSQVYCLDDPIGCHVVNILTDQLTWIGDLAINYTIVAVRMSHPA